MQKSTLTEVRHERASDEEKKQGKIVSNFFFDLKNFAMLWIRQFYGIRHPSAVKEDPRLDSKTTTT